MARRRFRSVKVTAKTIARSINRCTPLDLIGRELYLKTDKEYEAGSVIGILEDEENMQMVWGEVMEDAGFHRSSMVGSPRTSSPGSSSPNKKNHRFSAMVLRPILE